jgi:hypothetical protein
MKSDYTLSKNKKAVQNDIFERVQKKSFTKVIGLGGPNITQYLCFLKDHGIKHADIYENNRYHILLQISKFKPMISSKVYFQNIINAQEKQKDTLYDMDFCCSVATVKDSIKKFKDNSIFTFSIRPVGIESTIQMFFKSLRQNAKPIITYNHEVNKQFKVHKVDWNGNKYFCYIYKDTVPMMTITQF